MTQTLDIPVEALRLRMPDNVLKFAEPAIEGADGPKKPRFLMQVNSGIPFAHWWYGMLGINLAGITWKGNSVAALLDHDPSRRVGYTTKLYTDAELGLVAEGNMLSNEHAQQVRADSQEGFPFQASCYLEPTKVLRIEQGVSHTVNGHTFTGPGLVFEECTLREVTFCALGADPNTSSDATLDAEGAERVRVPLSVKVSTMTDNTKPTTTKEAPSPVDLEALRLEAQKAERDRVGFILKLAGKSQGDLARKLIDENATKEDAALALAEDARSRESAVTPTKQTPATAPMTASATATGEAPATAQDATLSMPEGEDKWRKQWAEDAKLQAEFGGNVNVWLSYNRNKHRCRDYGSKTAFDAAAKESV